MVVMETWNTNSKLTSLHLHPWPPSISCVRAVWPWTALYRTSAQMGRWRAGEGCKYPHRSQGRVVLTWTHGGNFTPLLDNTAGPNIAPYNISSYCRKSTKSWVHKIQNLDTMRTLDAIDFSILSPGHSGHIGVHVTSGVTLSHFITFPK